MFADHKGSWGIPYETRSGRKLMYFANYHDCKNSNRLEDNKPLTTIYFQANRNSFEKRLEVKACELCGCDNSEQYEIHHVNKVKNLKGKEHWERVMIAKKRKTIVVCHECHLKIHGKQKRVQID